MRGPFFAMMGAADPMDDLERFRGSLLGLAVGDALGHPTEFVGSVTGIRERWGDAGVTDFVSSGGHPLGTFTDDTQMSICVARALVRAGRADLDTLMDVLAEEFVAWSRSEENDRAPGGACMAGCRALAQGTPWRQAGVRDSKGCGAAMRAAPVGLYFAGDVDSLVRVAAAQSALTHRHPTGIASAVAAAAPVAHLVREGTLDGVLDFTRTCVERLDLDLLLEVGCTEELATTIGVGEMLAALDRTRAALGRETDDVCALLGGAWVGEEAVSAALWCVLKADGDFRDTVLRGANSSGDSDSIACIAGAIAGTLRGTQGIPEVWVATVEKTSLLEGLASVLHRAASEGDDPRALAGLDPFDAVRMDASSGKFRHARIPGESDEAPAVSSEAPTLPDLGDDPDDDEP